MFFGRCSAIALAGIGLVSTGCAVEREGSRATAGQGKLSVGAESRVLFLENGVLDLSGRALSESARVATDHIALRAIKLDEKGNILSLSTGHELPPELIAAGQVKSITIDASGRVVSWVPIAPSLIPPGGGTPESPRCVINISGNPPTYGCTVVKLCSPPAEDCFLFVIQTEGGQFTLTCKCDLV